MATNSYTATSVPDGYWVLDDHAAAPRGALSDSLWLTPFADGFRSCFARYGVLGEGLAAIVVDGWQYNGFRALDPDLIEERVATAMSMDVLETAESAARSFLGQLDDLEEGRRRLRMGLEGLDDASLAQRWGKITNEFEAAVRDRFADVAIGSLVAEYVLTAAEDLGWDEATAVASLGDIPASAAVATAVAAVAEAIRRGSPDVAQRLRSGEDVSLEAVLSTLDDADRATLDGLDDLLFELSPTSPTLGERPDVFVDLVRSHLVAEPRPDPVRAEVPVELSELADLARLGQTWRDESQNHLVRWMGLVRSAALEIGRRLEARGLIASRDRVFDLTATELRCALVDGTDVGELASDRNAARRRAAMQSPPPALGAMPSPPPDPPLPDLVARNMARVRWLTSRLGGRSGPPRVGPEGIEGIAASPGRYEGVARVLLGPDDFDRFEPGEVLVCGVTSPVWNAVIAVAGAVVSDCGGLAGHTALTARELGVPAVVDAKVATRLLRDGQPVLVDGTTGTVTPLEQ